MEPQIQSSWVLRAALALACGGLFVAKALPQVPADGETLPPGGTTEWEIRGAEEIVTFLLFDPGTPGIRLPPALGFVPARAIPMPQIQAHLQRNPDHADWAFSIIEITRQERFMVDGRSPILPENGGIGLWLAPVDHSALAGEIPQEAFERVIAPSLGSVLALGIWIPDREYVEFMRARGHYAEFGNATLVREASGAFHGEIRLGDLQVRVSAEPGGEIEEDPGSGTQVIFPPGVSVDGAVVIAGSSARHRVCEAEWSKDGDHPLAHGVFAGPTYLTTYALPLRGSAYRLRRPAEP